MCMHVHVHPNSNFKSCDSKDRESERERERQRATGPNDQMPRCTCEKAHPKRGDTRHHYITQRRADIGGSAPAESMGCSFIERANCNGCCWRRSTTSFQSSRSCFT